MQVKVAFTFFIFCIGCFAVNQAWATNAAIELEKAKLVSKFAKYVTWPENVSSQFIIGVHQDEEQFQYFSQYFKNKVVNNKNIVIRLTKTIGEARDVNILFIPSSKQRFLPLAFQKLSHSDVLLISENSVKLNKAMVDISYDINKPLISLKILYKNIKGTQLTVPTLSYLLDSDNDDELPFSPTYVLQNQQNEEILTLKAKLEKQQEQLSTFSKKLALSVKSSKKVDLNLKKQTKQLSTANQETLKKNQELEFANNTLKSLKEKLKLKQLELETQKTKKTEPAPVQASSLTPPLATITEEVSIQKQLIVDLEEKLRKKNEIINNNELKQNEAINSSLANSNFEVLFYIFALISIVVSVALFLLWFRFKKNTLTPKLENSALLKKRENQLIKSENLAALGYIATDITYEVGIALDSLKASLESSGDVVNAVTLRPVITSLENFNSMAADQDDTEFQKFDIVAYSRKMMTLFDSEFTQSNIDYAYSGQQTLTISSVPSYFALVLLNLVNNSLKHGFDNNGSGKITLRIDKDEKYGAKITYSDNGQGMSNEILAQVFKPFFTTQSDRGYLGLGMSNTHALICEKLSGKIQLTSEEGKGTAVTILLP